ncbi:tandem-95 repeat protein, partial [Endozoicomonadaceae bacterium StTr2]
TATVTVNPVNDAPTTNNASGSGDEDSTGINVELSGSDVDGTVASFVIKSLPANGTLKLADGTVLKVGDTVPATNGTAGVVFVPNENWNGSTDFNFAAKDNDGLEDPTPATATVTVNAVNDAPTTNNASGSGDEDSTGINVELSGADIDGTVASFVIKSLPANGTLKLADGTVLKVGDSVPATNGTAGVVFVPNENWNGSTDFNFAAKDNNGLEDPTPATATVTVNPVNDAPTTNNASGSGDEDSTGINVELSGSDVDGTVASFVIKSLPANGTLKLADGTVLKVGDTVPATNDKAGVVFVPNKDWNGSTDFNFAAKDNNGLEDPTLAKATVTVSATNDAPESSNDSVVTAEDTPKVLGVGDFGNYSDAENSPLAAVKITSLPTDGTLQYQNSSGQWVSVTQNQEISRADITGGKLRFVPDANENGSNYATLKFKVSDGTDFSDNDYTLRVDVTPVNDAPESTDDSITTLEDTPKVLGVDDFGNYSDVENSPLAAVKITSLPTDGTLQYQNSSGQWVSVTQNQEISRADITGGKLRFVPDANENGSNYATLKFKVSDGTDYSDNDYTLRVDVTPVNDAPTIDVIAKDFTENSAAENQVAATYTTADVDGDSLTVSWTGGTVPSDPDGDALYKLDTANNRVLLTQAGADHVNAGNDLPPINLTVTDNGVGNLTGKDSDDPNVTTVNDAPESSNDSITTPEDTPKVLGVSDFGNYSDEEGSALAAVKITSLPTDGTLQYQNSSGQWVSVTQNQEISRADITGGKLRFVPDANENGSNYATLKFKVSDGTDFSDNDYTLRVDVTPVNDAPESTDDTVTTAEDTPKVLGVGDFGNYSDVENSPLAAVKITSLPTDGTLQYQNSSGQWVSVTQNQEISRADITGGKLRFVPDANENGSNYATLKFKVSDGTDYSDNDYTLRVDVTAENDAPESSNDSITTPEDTPKVLGVGDFGNYSDVENSPLAAVKITSLPTDGTLQYQNSSGQWVSVTQNQEFSRADITGGKLRFVPDANENGSNYATLKFKVSDGTDFSDNDYTLRVDVTPVNDAPESTDDTVTTAEDTPKVLGVGDFGNYSDVENSPLAAVKITSLPTDGTLQYKNSSGQWVSVTQNQEISAADISGGKLRFVPDANENGSNYATLKFKVSDGTDYSDNDYTLRVDVTAENDAPESSNDSITTPEDTPKVLGVGDFGNYSDVENSPLAAVKITSLPTDGTLQYQNSSGQWVSVTQNQEISRADITGGKLRFVPDANENGSNYATLKFKVSDGSDFSDNDYTLRVDVTPVNDAPESTDDTVTTVEDTPKVLGVGDFGNYSDVENSPLASVKITSLPTDGTLQYKNSSGQWVSVTQNQEISAADISGGKLRFVPDANENGSNYATLKFKVSDGTDYSDNDYTLRVDVTAENDAPESSNDSITTPEDTPKVLGVGDFGNYSDVENSPLAAVRITSLPTDGTLQYQNSSGQWVSVTQNQEISRADITGGKLRFVPDANENGSNYATLKFKVSDGTDFSDNDYTLRVDVTPVNDAPESTDDSITTLEDTPKVLGVGDFGNYSDVENSPLASIKITSLPTDGKLQYQNSSGQWVSVTQNQEFSRADITGGKLRFVPDANENGSNYATLKFKVSDGTDYSDNDYTLRVDVTAENDAPESSNDSITTPEDTPKVLGVGDFGNYSDVENSPLAAVKITSLPTDGTLQYQNSSGQWVSVTQNQEISRADITGGKLRFVPDANENGSNYATLKFKVSDGTDFSDNDYTLRVDVTPVNDAPESTDDSITTLEDTPKVLGVGDFGNYSDVENSPLASIKITSLPTDGKLQYQNSSGQWVSVTQNQEFSRADITGGKLRFVPDANENGSNYATLKFKVSDGTDYSENDYTLRVDVTPVNDAPEANDDFFGVVLEDSTWDVNDTVGVIKNNDKEYDGDTLTVTHIRTGTENNPTNPVQGSVGKALVGKYGTLTLYPDGRFKYSADQDALDAEQGPLPVYDIFTYTVSDGNGKSDTAQITIAVLPRDDTSQYKPEVTLAEDTGVPTDKITANAGLKVVFNGDDNIAESNYTVEFSLFDSNTNTWSAWSKEYSPVAEGDNQSGVNKVKVRVIDPAGKVSQESDSITFTYKESPRSGVIDVNNFKDTDKGFQLTAKTTVQNQNGQWVLSAESAAHVEKTNAQYDYKHPDGFGAKGGGYEGGSGPGGHSVETGYHHGISEELIVNFDNQVQEAKVHFLWHGNGESAIIELWRGNQLVKVTNSDKNNNGDGGEDDVDPIITLKLANGETFDRIVFKAPGGPDDQNNDYLIKQIEFKEAPTPQTVTGDENDNILVGDPNGGTLVGKGGDDQLIGGDGADTFVFDLDDLVDNGTVQTDTIKDFTRHSQNAAEADKLDLSDLVSVSGNLTHQEIVDALKNAGLSVEFRNGDTVLHFEDQAQGSNKEELDIVLKGHEAGDWNNQNDVLLELVSNGQILV